MTDPTAFDSTFALEELDFLTLAGHWDGVIMHGVTPAEPASIVDEYRREMAFA